MEQNDLPPLPQPVEITLVDPPKKEDTNHLPDGKFAKGHKLARGNKYAEKSARYKALAYKCVTKDDFQQVIAKALEQAKTGDRHARQWIGDLVLGKSPINVAAMIGTFDATAIAARIDQIFGSEEQEEEKSEGG